MAKGGSPVGGGGFGGQQQGGFGGFGGGFGGQQQGFGGGYGMPQQQQGGFGGGFGGQQGGFGGGFGGMPQQQQGGFGGGFGGGYQPSRQRFNQMPQQQQSYGGGFGGQMGFPQQQQQGFGPDVNNYASPMRPMRPMVNFPAPQQERQYNQQANAVSQNMLQQYGGDQSNPAYQAAMQAQDQQLRGQFGIPQPAAAQPGSLAAAPQDFSQMREAQAAALQSRGMPQSDGGMDAGMGAYNQMSAERNMAARANQPPMNAQSLSQMANMLRGMGGTGGGSQSVLGQPGGNIIGRGPHEMPPSPYSQQMRQEDPRMQAMRMMQRMNFGGGGGYNF
jgi:hypothetical protein